MTHWTALGVVKGLREDVALRWSATKAWRVAEAEWEIEVDLVKAEIDLLDIHWRMAQEFCDYDLERIQNKLGKIENLISDNLDLQVERYHSL